METAATVTPSPSDGSRTLARTVDQANAGAHHVIDKISNAAHPVVDRISSGAHLAIDTVAGAAGQAVETLGVKSEQLKNTQRRTMEQYRGYVRANPVKAVGLGMAAGFLLSRLLSWSSR